MKYVIATFLLFYSVFAFSQTENADSLLNSLSSEIQTENLLPERMMLSQRVFWGEKGLFRVTHIAPKLTIENRQKELRVRRNMFKVHQAVGILTFAGMLTQGVLGAKIYNFDFTNNDISKYNNLKNLHSNLATGINVAYGTTALMAFMSPPKQINRKGISNMKVHKALSYIHLSGMITTNILSDKIKGNPNLKPYHRAAAYTTFAAYAAAIAIIKFEF